MRVFLPIRNIPFRYSSQFSIFLVPVFFVVLADTIMAYSFPIFVEQVLGSNTMLGIIMALSSVAGITFDFLIPQIFRPNSWRVILFWGILLSMIFPLTTVLGTLGMPLVLFTIATLSWGIYFEFMQFSQQDFVATEESSENLTKDWGILNLVGEFTALIGPIIASLLLHTHHHFLITVWLLQFTALIFVIFFFFKPTDRISFVNTKRNVFSKKSLRFIKNFFYIKILGRRMWPLVTITLCYYLISASFWTIGGLFGEILESKQNNIPGWSLIFLFNLALFFGAIVVSLLKIQKKKKKLSQVAMMLGSAILMSTYIFEDSPVNTLLILFAAAIFFSFSLPLVEAVYSELSQRSAKAEIYILTISRIISSLSYICAPLLVGILSDRIGYSSTFSIIGLITFLIALSTFILTPRKIRLPQKDLSQLKVSGRI